MANKVKEIAFKVYRTETESPAAAEAKAALRPSAQAAQTLRHFHPFHGGEAAGSDPNETAAELQACAKAVSGNDLTRLESMLTIQAHTLDAIFNDMARRAALNRGEYLDATDKFMRLALKAQSQCRATIETLAEIKNPKPVAFVQQANIAAGPQQVNNGVSPPAHASARAGAGNQNQSSELMEGAHGNRLEHRTAEEGITGDSALATLGKGDRAEVARG